jgi:hypothetical protein
MGAGNGRHRNRRTRPVGDCGSTVCTRSAHADQRATTGPRGATAGRKRGDCGSKGGDCGSKKRRLRVRGASAGGRGGDCG